MNKLFRLFLISFFVSCFIFTAVFYYLIYLPSGNIKSQIFEIKPGESFKKITKKLYKKNHIRNSLAFEIFARLKSQSRKISVGEFLIRPEMTPAQILEIFVKGKSIEYFVTFPEGVNIYEMAKILEERNFIKKKIFLSLCHNKNFIESLLGKRLYSLEGYLFPETYHYSKYTKPKDFIATMVKRFLKIYNSLGSGTVSMKRHEQVILASIIEKETAAVHERELISSVFHNRIQKKMRLQTDPTIIYGITVNSGGIIPKNIRKKDILQKTDYNTYRIDGFPKGPISNPGKGALRAATRPANSDYLYFVSRNNGTHIFSESFKDHNKAVYKFQKRKRLRKRKKPKKRVLKR